MQTHLPPQHWGCERVSHNCHIAIILPFHTSECFTSCCWLVLLRVLCASSPKRRFISLQEAINPAPQCCSHGTASLCSIGTGHPIPVTPSKLLTHSYHSHMDQAIRSSSAWKNLDSSPSPSGQGHSVTTSPPHSPAYKTGLYLHSNC